MADCDGASLPRLTSDMEYLSPRVWSLSRTDGELIVYIDHNRVRVIRRLAWFCFIVGEAGAIGEGFLGYDSSRPAFNWLFFVAVALIGLGVLALGMAIAARQDALAETEGGVLMRASKADGKLFFPPKGVTIDITSVARVEVAVGIWTKTERGWFASDNTLYELRVVAGTGEMETVHPICGTVGDEGTVKDGRRIADWLGRPFRLAKCGSPRQEAKILRAAKKMGR